MPRCGCLTSGHHPVDLRGSTVYGALCAREEIAASDLFGDDRRRHIVGPDQLELVELTP